MDMIRTLMSRFAALFGRRKLDAELDEELRTHIDFAVEENLKHGMNAQQPARRPCARSEALRRPGRAIACSVLPFFEYSRRTFAMRCAIAQAPGLRSFAVDAGAGHWSTTALFSVVDA